jgi:hypothetical protein
MRSIAFLNIIRQDFVQNINGEVSVHFGRVLKFFAEAFPSFSTPKRDVVSQFYDNICKFSSNIESCFLNQIQFPGGEGGEFQGFLGIAERNSAEQRLLRSYMLRQL